MHMGATTCSTALFSIISTAFSTFDTLLMIVSQKNFFGPTLSWLRITLTANQAVKIHPKPRQNAKLDAKCRRICDWTDNSDIRGENRTLPVQLTMFLTTIAENESQKFVSALVSAAFCNQRNVSVYDWTSLRYVSLHVQNLAGYHITVRLSFAKKMGIIFSYLHTSIAAFTKSWQLHVASPTTLLTATEISSVTLLVPVTHSAGIFAVVGPTWTPMFL